MSGDTRRRVKSYVLRSGRISTGQQRALDALFDTYCVDFRNGPLKRGELVGYDEKAHQKTVLEIGFGMGSATAQIAEKNPDTLFIGVEVFLAGVGKLLSEIGRCNLGNITIVRHDAAEVIQEMIPDSWLDGFHIFFPDPWPKKKHHKRRLIQPEFVELLVTKLVTGGYIYAVTDWEDYAEHMLRVLTNTTRLIRPEGSVAVEGYSTPQVWRPETKFEAKGLRKNHTIRELYFVKNQ